MEFWSYPPPFLTFWGFLGLFSHEIAVFDVFSSFLTYFLILAEKKVEFGSLTGLFMGLFPE